MTRWRWRRTETERYAPHYHSRETEPAPSPHPLPGLDLVSFVPVWGTLVLLVLLLPLQKQNLISVDTAGCLPGLSEAGLDSSLKLAWTKPLSSYDICRGCVFRSLPTLSASSKACRVFTGFLPTSAAGHQPTPKLAQARKSRAHNTAVCAVLLTGLL